jgi:hypothetical protein
MRYAACHLSHGIDPRCMRQTGLLCAQAGLRFGFSGACELAKSQNCSKVKKRCNDDRQKHLHGGDKVGEAWRDAGLENQRLRRAAEDLLELRRSKPARAGEGRAVRQQESTGNR